MKLSFPLSHHEFNYPDHLRILVVEDEFYIRMFLSQRLRDAGYEVVEAHDAAEALVALRSITPHLIISDVRMPGSMDGMGLLKVVKANYPDIPVIIASAHFDPDIAINEGAAEFITKPYSLELVLASVTNLLKQQA
jgi:DNA-binding NtrC family response regulator